MATEAGATARNDDGSTQTQEDIGGEHRDINVPQGASGTPAHVPEEGLEPGVASTPRFPPNRGIPNFAERAEFSLGRATASALTLANTRRTRVLRRFSIAELTELLEAKRNWMPSILKHPDAPEGELRGRERVFSIEDLMQLRAISAAKWRSKNRRTLHWRRPGDRLPVITCASQKGGTGKTVTAVNIAQHANTLYGMRVAVVDCDPQGSCSLYFADDSVDVAGLDTPSFTDFMGVPSPERSAQDPNPIQHEPAELDAFLRPTPWPGIRLMPAGVSIQEADIAMHFLGRNRVKIYRMLRDAITRWSEAHPPKTAPEDLLDRSGRLDTDRLAAALRETVDLVVIDTAPSLTTAQLNAVVAADTLIIPQTVRGFDLSTLRIYLSSLLSYMHFIGRYEDQDPIPFGALPSYVLPTIISTQSDTDMRMAGALYAQDPEVVMPLWYKRSDAVANSSETYTSIYEHQPSHSRKDSAKAFLANAYAVSEAILCRAIPGLPSRGYANAFLRDLHGDEFPLWTEEPPR